MMKEKIEFDIDKFLKRLKNIKGKYEKEYFKIIEKRIDGFLDEETDWVEHLLDEHKG